MDSTFAPLCDGVFEALPCEIVVHDVDTIVAANAAACRLLEAASPRSLVGLPIGTVTHPDSRDAGADRRRLLFAQSQSYPCLRVKLVGLKGTEVSTNVLARRFDLGALSFAMVVGLDGAGECPHAPGGWERELPTFPDGIPLMTAVLDAFPHPITIFDASDHIVFANAAATRALRAEKREQLIGRSPSSVLHPLVRDAAAQRRRLVLDQGQAFTGIRGKAVALDGVAMDTVSSLGRAHTPDGQPVGYWMAHSVVPSPVEAAVL